MDKQLLLFSLIGGLVLIISVLASKATTRIGVPILLLFIGIGMLMGSDGPGGIIFNDHKATNIFGTVALIFILFAGGITSVPFEIKPIWKEGVVLSTVGVFLTTIFMTCLIHFTMDWNWLSSAILSAAVSSTDAPAIFGILKTQRREIKTKLKALLEVESGSNDPMAVVILLLLIQFANAPEESSLLLMAQKFFIQISLGGLAGWFLGKSMAKIINWLNLNFEGLYPVFTMAAVICIYSLTEYCGGNGYLAVYLAGFAMAGEKFLSKQSLLVFHDGLSWLMQVGVFLILGLLVNPSELPGVMKHSLVFAFGLIFFVRPLVVSLCLVPMGLRNWKEILFLSWGGLKGAVAIILATYLLVENVPHAKVMFNVIFFIVIISMALQGSTICWLAEKLGVASSNTPRGFEPHQAVNKTNEFIEFEIPTHSTMVGRSLIELELPVHVVLIHRDSDDFIPKGNTEVHAHDRLVCLVNRKVIPEIRHMLESSQNIH